MSAAPIYESVDDKSLSEVIAISKLDGKKASGSNRIMSMQ